MNFKSPSIDGPPQFPIYVPVIFESLMVTELITQVNISHVVIVEVDGFETVKWNLEFFLNYYTPVCDFQTNLFLRMNWIINKHVYYHK